MSTQLRWTPIITNAGLALEARSHGNTFVFTKAQCGAGSVPIDELANQTSIADFKSALAITSMSTMENIVKLRLQLSNKGLEQGFDLRQIGVYAKISTDATDVLYMIIQAATPDHIPSATASPNYVNDYLTHVFSSNAEKIEATMDAAAYVTHGELGDITGDLAQKADKVIPSKAGNLAALGADGGLVDSGTGGSSNDFTDEDKAKLTGVEAGAQVNVIESVKVNGVVQTVTNKTVDVVVSLDKVGDLKGTVNLKEPLGDKWLPCDGRILDPEVYPELNEVAISLNFIESTYSGPALRKLFNSGPYILGGTNHKGCYYSNNYGVSWSKSSSSDDNFYYFCTVSGSSLVAVGDYAHISNNYGQSWSQMPLRFDGQTCSVFAGANNVVLVGTSGSTYISTNGGSSWGVTSIKAGSSCTFIFGSNGRIIASSHTSTTCYSDDNGASWVQSGSNLYSTLIANALNGRVIIGATGSGVKYSDDNGLSWKASNYTSGGIRSFAKCGNRLFCGTSANIKHSDDNGHTWVTSLALAAADSIVSVGDYVVAVSVYNTYISADRGNTWVLQTNIGGGYGGIITDGGGALISTGKIWYSLPNLKLPNLPNFFIKVKS